MGTREWAPGVEAATSCEVPTRFKAVVIGKLRAHHDVIFAKDPEEMKEHLSQQQQNSTTTPERR